MSAILIFLAFYLFVLLFAAVTLWLAAKLFKFPASSFARTLSVAAILSLLVPLLNVPQLFLPSTLQLPYSLLALAGQVFLIWFIIKRFHRTSTGRAWAAFGFYMASQFISSLVAIIVIRLFFVEAYVLPTNGMSPTIRGLHRVTDMRCPNCGGPVLMDASEFRIGFAPSNRGAICAACYRGADLPASTPAGSTIAADRVLVTKFSPPHRWDIVAYRRPSGDIYLQRIVALPNESIAIDQQGRISINDSVIGGPPDHPGLLYPWPGMTDSFPHVLNPGVPLRLAPDEYFVIGDNSTHSHDSRFFGPIHAPDIIGVTTMIYWPPNRLKIIR